MICEIFPLQLRIDLELLSKRRDIVNKEKQTELFKLLQQYNIDAVALGAGTNRYAFKLNSFAIKFATNNDGKIDNLKEFKMAQRLYPNVIKVYEVSANGTILITEYIQPFENFSEMLVHEKEIKGILSDMSSVYMFGDVGVVEKNYSNWGVRIGSNEPVCLDFAYVYDVSSSIFICNACQHDSMLTLTSDYAALKCPSCGKMYQFEDIRRRIGNDLHKNEIGDLSNEGYVLGSSNVLTTLDETRSGYLKKKHGKQKNIEVPEPEEEKLVDDFIMP
jgi:predicted RNA-binding Zn-ribbon protein involved in translation (DUF1610 family)